jgi:hypothetical protein
MRESVEDTTLSIINTLSLKDADRHVEHVAGDTPV